MLQYATGWREDAMPGRRVILARHRRRAWEIIVEPDEVEQVVVVITAYPIDRQPMRAPYLEVTYRHGKPLAAYLYLPRAARECSSSTRQFAGGLVVDYNASDEPIGVELTAPTRTTVADLNLVLATVCPTADPPTQTEADLAPLRAA